MSRDIDYMKTALALAERGRGYASPNPMVGAVIVKDGQVVGKGWHEHAGGPHAEVNAIAAAGPAARGATLYVTLEPCNHHGRTPPCTEAVIAAGISRVVIAMADPNPNVAGGGADFLAEKGLRVETGLCEAAAKRLNEFFITHTLTRRPFVTLKCAATLDGYIATKSGDSKWVTGPTARRQVHRMRHAMDAILVGVGTVKADDPSLTARLDEMEGRNPVRIILDSRLSIPEDAKVLRQHPPSDTVIATGEAVDGQKAARIQATGARVLKLPLCNERVDLSALLDHLGQTGITSLLVEGGGRVSGSFLSEGRVDKICFFYAPKILAGEGIPMCSGPGPERMASAVALADMKVTHFGDDILVEGYILKKQ